MYRVALMKGLSVRVMSVIIPRNSPIPCVKTQTYTTEENYQASSRHT
jgi:molecular chaperone DnaK (HSP70)